MDVVGDLQLYNAGVRIHHPQLYHKIHKKYHKWRGALIVNILLDCDCFSDITNAGCIQVYIYYIVFSCICTENLRNVLISIYPNHPLSNHFIPVVLDQIQGTMSSEPPSAGFDERPGALIRIHVYTSADMFFDISIP